MFFAFKLRLVDQSKIILSILLIQFAKAKIPNKSKKQRAVLLIEFLPKYIKPVEDLVSCLSTEFINNCSKRVKHLLGFNYEYPKIMDISNKNNDIGIGYKAKK